MPSRIALAVALAAALTAATARPSRAQAPATPPGGWVGQRVITHFGTVLNDPRTAKLDDEGRTWSLEVNGHDRNEFRIYKVEFVNGSWLWLRAEKGTAEGWVDASRVVPYDQATDYLTGLIRAEPGTAALYIWRGNVWNEKGELDIAIADYNEAIRLDPKEAIAYNNRGNAWSDKKEYDKAIADYAEAIQLDPKFTNAYVSRGIAWRAKTEYDKAIADYGEVIRIDPKDANAYNGRAWLRATCPETKYRDGKAAVADANRACELSEWKVANDVGTLAAAHAEDGDFAWAIEMQEKAQGLYKDEDAIKKGRERLALYRAKTPYRQDQGRAVAVAEAPGKGKAAEAKAIRMYLPTAEIGARFGDDPRPKEDYIAALKARLNVLMEQAEPPSAKGMLVAVGLKGGRRARVWCQAVEGDVPAPLLRTIEAELAEVPAPELKKGPAGFALDVALLGRAPSRFPEFPDRWRDASAASRSKTIVPPDDLFRLIWPD